MTNSETHQRPIFASSPAPNSGIDMALSETSCSRMAQNTLPTLAALIGCSMRSRSCSHTCKADRARTGFQFWKLGRPTQPTATLTCDDGNGKIVYSKEIEFTDFPLDEITFYFTNNVIYLPSEH